MIFKFALPTGHSGQRMIPIRLQTRYEYDNSPNPILRNTGFYFTVEPGANRIHVQCRDVYGLSLSMTSRESREAYLPVFSRRLSLRVGVIHFSPDTIIYLAKLCHILVNEDLKAILTAVDHLAGPSHAFQASFNQGLNSVSTSENLQLWWIKTSSTVSSIFWSSTTKFQATQRLHSSSTRKGLGALLINQ
ncbi:hypothetical protein BDZ45DRAFT_351822 [Acephala macrosclerotiorum]|nr:hypothetical protein BDZ45DRAFT_351822 [Acephala macrosclerotiorum]